jgi:hypothetical protein
MSLVYFEHTFLSLHVQNKIHTPSVPKYLSRLIFYIKFDYLFY